MAPMTYNFCNGRIQVLQEGQGGERKSGKTTRSPQMNKEQKEAYNG